MFVASFWMKLNRVEVFVGHGRDEILPVVRAPADHVPIFWDVVVAVYEVE